MKMKFYFFQIVFVLLADWMHGQGTFIYDQQSADENTGSGARTVIQTGQPIGQSFTPTLTSVGFIRLKLSDGDSGNNLGATVYVNLRTNSITGTLLSSSAPVFMPDGFSGHPNFLFSTPVSVTPGQTYCFEPVVQSGDLCGIVQYNSYFYTGGIEYFQGAPFPTSDLWFREGIIVPKISIELTNGKPLIRFPTFSNQNYSVEYSPDLSSGSWSNLLGTNIQGNGQAAAVLDTKVTMSINRFYRLKLVP